MASQPFPHPLDTVSTSAAMDTNMTTSASTVQQESKGINWLKNRRQIMSEGRKVQNLLKQHVAMTQQEPDADLDAALAAFGITHETANLVEPVPAGNALTRPGHYNFAGRFVIPPPRKPRKASSKEFTGSVLNKVKRDRLQAPLIS